MILLPFIENITEIMYYYYIINSHPEVNLMIIVKDRAVYNYINEIHLRLADFGYATGGPEWSARNVLDSMVHSRLWYIISGDPYIVANGVKTYLKPGNCYLLPAGFRFSYY